MMNLKKKQKGVVAVETALVLPLLLLIVFGIVEFGLALYDQAVITNAAREGARAGIVLTSPRPTTTDITSVVTGYTSSYLISFAAKNPAPSVSVTNAGGSFGTALAVKVSYTFTGLLLGPLMNPLTGPITLSSTATMNNE
ncbi:TadE/TadG family type IV pilus assembly protein [Paraburkholderia sp. BR13439]|uniref:Flp pilus assembly protein TadG n=2 Tax=Burkholderiaceae TaxID=119060 RepID=A0A7W8P6Z7_9BURK|nr:TadE/TadG family type IV pilus assembly protein [Paraburkholderia youngii]MBB5402317.1 Flp pilus assembly protein TadG [Paraburkholderia youngii]NUX53829.1 pilus assembly protein [Paraburkholderia youngii]NVH71937.1 pilus assembly protein [Paraburkholderia youngii]